MLACVSIIVSPEIEDLTDKHVLSLAPVRISPDVVLYFSLCLRRARISYCHVSSAR